MDNKLGQPTTDKQQSPVSLADWLATPLGAYTLAQERAWLDKVVPDIFGYHAVQFGLAEFDLLRESRMTHRVVVSPTMVAHATVAAQFHELPFETNSVDLCLLPHTLEFADNPHDILREVDRILRPEGRVIIIGFNPWSLFGIKRFWSSNTMPWCGQFISLVRMKDWLQLLGFEASQGHLCCYIPPVQSNKWQRRWRFMERTGDRWWGVAGGVYMFEAIKRVQGVRLMGPAWTQAGNKKPKFAAVAQNTCHNRHGSSKNIVPHLKVVK